MFNILIDRKITTKSIYLYVDMCMFGVSSVKVSQIRIQQLLGGKLLANKCVAAFGGRVWDFWVRDNLLIADT